MLLFLPWVLFGIGVLGIIVLIDDYMREARYNQYQEEIEEIRLEKERLMAFENGADPETEYYISA